MSTDPRITDLQKAADQCVKCAVCLPHCPTYALAREEAESPRGRITLLQGIVHGQLPTTDEVHQHLDSCLSCGRCEQVCPANVPYTRLLDGTRFLMNEPLDGDVALSPEPRAPAGQSTARGVSQPTPTVGRRLMARVLSTPPLLRQAHRAARTAQRLQLEKLLGKSRAGRLLRSLPNHPASTDIDRSTTNLAGQHEIRSNAHTAIQATLFTGCLSDTFERQATQAAIEVATSYGLQLHPSPQGLCCGAIYQHQGNQRAFQLAEKALAALTDLPQSVDLIDRPIVALQSGCGRGLKDGLRHLDGDQATQIAGNIVDLFELLEQSVISPSYRKTEDKAALYAPCSYNESASQCMKVIRRDVAAIGEVVRGHGCCGAAGDHMLTQPERADRLAAPIIQNILANGYSHVLTPNAGCAWHLRANLRALGSKVVVEHPLVWMARHLRR